MYQILSGTQKVSVFSAGQVRLHRLCTVVPADRAALTSSEVMRSATLNCQLGVALAVRALAMKSPEDRVGAWQLPLGLFKALQSLGLTKAGQQ